MGRILISSSSSSTLCEKHPFVSVPQNTQSPCFNANGTCYKCKSERGSACGEEWLWKGNFNPGNVGYWYTEVDCYNPFEDNHDGQCPDGSILQKRVANSDNGSKEGYVDYTMELLNTQKYYDVLGRNVNRNLKRKQALYRLDRMSNQNSTLIENSGFSQRIRRMLNRVCLNKIGLQKQKLVGDNMVYVSGFCTDEQLQVIRERKKNREEVLTLW